MNSELIKNFNKIYQTLNFNKVSEITDFITELLQKNDVSLLKEYNLKEFTKTDWQLLIESIVINVLVNNGYDFNQRLTPPPVGLIFSEIISILSEKQSANIVDFGSGTGGLIFSVLTNLQNEKHNAIAIDNNEELLNFSMQYRNFFDFQNSIKFIFNDALAYEPVEKVDFVIGDLPVGYYPQTKKIDHFKVAVKEDLSYIQNLLIEKSLQILNDSGFAIFAVPENIFTSSQNGVLLNMLKESAYLQGIISLPLNSFTDKKFVKNIVIIQKKGKHAKQIAPVLIYQMDDIENLESYQKLFRTLNAWGAEIKNKRM